MTLLRPTQPPEGALSRIGDAARRGALAGLASAVGFLVIGAESALRGGEMHYRDALQLVPWVLAAVTLAFLHATQRHVRNRVELVGFWSTMGAMSVAASGQIGLISGVERLAPLAFPVGALLWLAAMAVYGVGTYRAGVVPKRVGVAIALLEPGSILTGIALSPLVGLHDRGNYSGALEKGVVMLLIAAALGSLGSARVAAARRHVSG